MPMRSTTVVRIQMLGIGVTTLVRGRCARRWSMGVAPTWSKELVLSLTTLVLRCVPSMCLGNEAWQTRELLILTPIAWWRWGHGKKTMMLISHS